MKIDQFDEVPDSSKEERVVGARGATWYKRPTKEEVRRWLARVVASRRPPPSIDEIQRDLWHLGGSDEDRGMP